MKAAASFTHARTADANLPVITEGRYTVRLAANLTEIDAALQLRFNVFNLELGEGLDGSYITGRDEDVFDGRCHHLIAIDNETDEVVGTYRLQTLESAGTVSKFYSSTEYDLASLPIEVVRNGLEIGRACIAVEHRHTKVLYLLWKGLARMMKSLDKQYLFGCCSLMSEDPSEGIKALATLERIGAIRSEFWCEPLPGFRCRVNEAMELDGDFALPKLFSAYLRFGAKVISPPAIDRSFGTIDFLVIFDRSMAGDLVKRMFFSESLP